MKRKQREPEIHIVCLEEDGELNMYIECGGVRIAKRGHPDTRHAKTWIPLEPGWVVRDIGHYKGVEIEYVPTGAAS